MILVWPGAEHVCLSRINRMAKLNQWLAVGSVNHFLQGEEENKLAMHAGRKDWSTTSCRGRTAGKKMQMRQSATISIVIDNSIRIDRSTLTLSHWNKQFFFVFSTQRKTSFLQESILYSNWNKNNWNMLASTSTRVLRRAVASPASRRAMSTSHTFDITGSFEVSRWSQPSWQRAENPLPVDFEIPVV